VTAIFLLLIEEDDDSVIFDKLSMCVNIKEHLIVLGKDITDGSHTVYLI
jgi:hypothetical protein